MGATLLSIASGLEGTLINVECVLSNGLPNIVIVGFANKAVDESKERVRSAFASSNLSLPKKRITINLAPADLPKDSPALDLAIAASILVASKQATEDLLQATVLLGELGLGGETRPVRGIIGSLLSAQKKGIERFYIPVANLPQAKLVPDIEIKPVANLRELFLDITGAKPVAAVRTNRQLRHVKLKATDVDFQHVIGQARAKRALEIAAAGSHNILLNGPPGTGKSMLAKALPGILPDLTQEEILEITHLHSLTSRDFDGIVSKRPFRAPHHSASEIAIIGGGQNPKPGEISLSHKGVLFFDELPEFSRMTIEALRQPLEDRVITVARAKDSITFPADFTLVATANPCPCGYYGSTRECSCLPAQIIKYQRKLSGPIMDRIDLYIEVDHVKHDKLLDANAAAEPSESIQKRVQSTRKLQRQRYQSDTKTNASLSNQEIKTFCQLEKDARELLDTAAERLDISARSYMRILKVSRTVADLASAEKIGSQHVSEALQYRKQPVRL